MKILRFSKVGTLHPGDMFGELGLIYKRPRQATIIAPGTVELGKLCKESFFKSFGRILAYEDQIKNEFCESCILKQPKLRPFATQFMLMFEREKYQENSMIVKEGQKIDKVFLIFKGTIAICKNYQKNLINLEHAKASYQP